ncbi:hypothetical protein NA57DRAFT_52368 [Rhizodiscina lignyota]|uniref:Uncharacterized protein n=1 Tax=Rhizodiscina lignyota TaxID=1504668 RepID=A0A9P4IJM3_9PEZI|nr:hypothetical protein NA57DRAFT_52368 [Rhizodiscina lignyota]
MKRDSAAPRGTMRPASAIPLTKSSKGKRKRNTTTNNVLNVEPLASNSRKKQRHGGQSEVPEPQTRVSTRGQSRARQAANITTQSLANGIDLQPTAVRALSSLEKLPTELLQEIWVLSVNLSLPFASPQLAAKLNDGTVCKKLFRHCAEMFNFVCRHCADGREVPAQASDEMRMLWTSPRLNLRIYQYIRQVAAEKVDANSLKRHSSSLPYACVDPRKHLDNLVPLLPRDLPMPKWLSLLPFTEEKDKQIGIYLNAFGGPNHGDRGVPTTKRLFRPNFVPGEEYCRTKLISKIRTGDAEGTLFCIENQFAQFVHPETLSAIVPAANDDLAVSRCLGIFFSKGYLGPFHKAFVSYRQYAYIPTPLWDWMQCHLYFYSYRDNSGDSDAGLRSWVVLCHSGKVGRRIKAPQYREP